MSDTSGRVRSCPSCGRQQTHDGISWVHEGGWIACHPADASGRSPSRSTPDPVSGCGHVCWSCAPDPRPFGADTMTDRPRVVIDPAVCSGEPCVGGRRIPVEHVAGSAWWYGVDEAESCYDISRADVLVACWYAAVFPIRCWGRDGLKAQRNPYPRRWREWADISHKALWSSDYDAVSDPPMRPLNGGSEPDAVEQPAAKGNYPPTDQGVDRDREG